MSERGVNGERFPIGSSLTAQVPAGMRAAAGVRALNLLIHVVCSHAAVGLRFKDVSLFSPHEEMMEFSFGKPPEHSAQCSLSSAAAQMKTQQSLSGFHSRSTNADVMFVSR